MVLLIIKELAEEDYAKICKVNIDEQLKLAKKFRVLSIPLGFAVIDGEIVKRKRGKVKSKKF